MESYQVTLGVVGCNQVHCLIAREWFKIFFSKLCAVVRLAMFSILFFYNLPYVVTTSADQSEV